MFCRLVGLIIAATVICINIDPVGAFSLDVNASPPVKALSSNSKLTPVTTREGLRFLSSSSRGQAHKYLAHLLKKYGENFLILGKYAILHDPAAIRDVLVTHNLEKAPEVMRGYRSLFGGGCILAAPWNEWRAQRQLVGSALMESVVGELTNKFEEGSQAFFAHLNLAASLGEQVEMDGAFTAVTLDIIGLVLFGQSLGIGERLGRVDETEPFVDALEVLAAEAVRQTGNPELLVSKTTKSRKGQRTKDRLKRVKRRLLRRRRIRKAKAFVDKFLERCIKLKLDRENRQKRGTGAETDASKTTDLLDILLNAESKGLISRDDVKAQLLTFIFAGHDTTAHTLAWLLWEVSQDAALQDGLAAEAKKALPAWDDLPRDAILAKFPLLDRVFKEALRKHPAAANGTLRVVGEVPVIVGNSLELPAHARVLIPPYSLHRNERYWPNPEVFDPSRFEEEVCASRDPWAYQPFSGGPRNCVGSRLASVEALSLLAPLFRRYEISYVGDDSEPADYCGLVRRPRNGVFFTFKRRA